MSGVSFLGSIKKEVALQLLLETKKIEAALCAASIFLVC
ncbi:hypothetical protein APA_16 [Pseudanabaena sp. lw0831]|nr:hypothetical protein APA_16 [Pseudanabaena sp. lw0831]